MIRFYFLFSLVVLMHTTAFSKTCFSDNQDPIVIQIDSLQSLDCAHAFGYVSVEASGGTPGYTFSWNTGATGPVLSGVLAGEYTVEVTDSDGSTAELKITVEADYALPLADAGGTILAPCNNSLLTLAGSGSTGPVFTYGWAASNGGHIVSGAQSLSPLIDHAGTYSLTVTNQANGCTASDAGTVNGQNVAPSALAMGGVLNCAAPSLSLGVEFTHANTTFSWQGPSGFFSVLEHPVVSIQGNYVFTLTDTLTGCLQKSTAIVTSNFTPPNVDASGNGTITCAQPTVQLFGASSTPGVSYQWTGPNGFQSAMQNTTVNNAGTYTLTVQNPANGCTAVDAVTVASNLTSPVATAAVSGQLNCSTPSVQLIGMSNTPGVSYLWSGPNNYSSSLQNPATSAPGVYTLTIKNPVNGCTGTATAAVMQNIVPPNVSASGGIKTCSAPLVTLMGNSNTPGVSYSWTGPNNFVSTQQNPVVSIVGLYTLKVSNPINGCTASTAVNVSQNTSPPSVWATSGTITCATPMVTITTNAVPQGLSYSWTGPNNFSSGAQNPMVGAAGYYYVTATNPANGCTNTSSVYVPENKTLPFAYAGEDKSLNCYFSSILINASFSSNGPNYTYVWSTFDGNIVSGVNTLYPRVDLEGTYTLKVTNTQNGCMDLDSMVVTQSPPLGATITQNSPVSCAGGSNGAVTVVADGGGLSYGYKWSNGALSAQASGLTAGTYTVTVTDSEGCTATASAVVNQLILTANINVTHQTIPGLNNGTATVLPIGGTSPYTIKWSNNATTMAISNLAPGPYTATLTDTKGCTLEKTTNVNAANCAMNGTISSVNVACFGASNGSATLNLNGAGNPVSYLWSNGATAKTAAGLSTGTYTVTATDAGGCQVIQIVQISSPPALTAIAAAISPVRCPGSSDGSITAGVNGGVQPYTYLWSNGGANATVSNLPAGWYTLTVTDANACSSALNAQITSPSAITISVASKTDVTCPSASNGAIAVNVQGGMPPYQYFWSNGSTLSALSGLMAGNYTLTVTDNNDCPKSISIQIQVADLTPPLLQLKNATVDLDITGSVAVSASLFDNGSSDDCGIASWTVTPSVFNCAQIGANNVTITAADPSGNVSTQTVVLTVVDNFLPTLSCPANINRGVCNNVVPFNLPQVQDNCQFVPAQLSQVGGLPSGSAFPVGATHQVFQYTDASGNSGQCSFDIIVEKAPELTAAVTPTTCANSCEGAIALTPISGGNFTVFWNNGQSGLQLAGLCPGTYIGTITDVFNCTQTQSLTISIVDTQMPVLTCPANIVKGYCNNTVFFGQPLVSDNCTVNPANLLMTGGQASGTPFPIGTSTQSFSYDDGNGNIGNCSFTIQIIGPPTVQTSVQPASCANACDGKATLAISGNSPSYSVQWNNGQVGLQASNLCAGIYNYVVNDINGCVLTGSASIAQPSPVVVTVEQVHNDPGNLGSGSINVQVSGGVPPYTYSWTRNGLFFASLEDLTNLFQGQYVGLVTDANGCTQNTGTIAISNAVSVHLPAWAHTLNMSPNPANDWVLLDFGAPLDQDVELNIMDLRGKTILRQVIQKSTEQTNLEVSVLPEGLYLLRFSLETGIAVTLKMIVVR